MRPLAFRSSRRLLPCLVALTLFAPSVRSLAQDEPAPDSPYVRLLKSGKLPAERLGVAINGIGQRGGVNDLNYLFERVLDPAGFPPALRPTVLDVLADTARNRKLRPSSDLAALAKILAEPNLATPTTLATFRLAGAWKVEAVAPSARSIAATPRFDLATRGLALETLAALGGAENRAAIEGLTSDTSPAVAGRAVAALARIDVAAAADRAARAIGSAKAGQDLAPVIAAFVDLQGGADKLAAALDRQAPPADAAKLGLRALYALGHADESLVATLSKAAGIEAETKPLGAPEMEALLADVAKTGDPARGEAIFRRAELNCMKCHSLGAAGGGVGPDLSAVGVSSPVDYLVNSILLPDLAIKEVYETLMVLTDDGRVFQGIVVEKDDTKIVLKDATAEVRTIPAASVEESKTGGSLMPKGLANLLTRAEFVDLVRFLAELGKPGPYVVQTTPTVHRWRVLTGAEPAEPTASRTAFLQTEESLWQPVYSRANGDLPLAEAAALAGAPTVVVQAEVVASAAGPVALRLDSNEAVSAYLDDRPIALSGTDPVNLPAGRHKLTFLVDTAKRTSPTLKVEITRTPGSSAEYAIVVGK